MGTIHSSEHVDANADADADADEPAFKPCWRAADTERNWLCPGSIVLVAALLHDVDMLRALAPARWRRTRT